MLNKQSRGRNRHMDIRLKFLQLHADIKTFDFLYIPTNDAPTKLLLYLLLPRRTPLGRRRNRSGRLTSRRARRHSRRNHVSPTVLQGLPEL